jgi:eukaryotic-like serine/threonine-protein kinase
MVGQNIGKYRVQDRIGRGGMGTVYRAIDETLHREVAIKVLNAELNDPEVAKRFRAEAITVARLSHPGIATIYELFQHEGQWLMVMEFVRGETLEHMAERMGTLSPQRAAEISMQCLAALAHAHSMGVVHRDLKPANLMITETGAIKVMDFGIARVAGTEHLTSAGYMMGTPAYMAPEQVTGNEIDARADLYALGVVFYRLTAGRLPFRGDTPFAMAQSQVNDPPTPIGTVRNDLPPWVEQVVVRALAKAPEERFQSAIEFHEAFARCLSGLPMAVPYNSSAQTEMLMTPTGPLSTGGFSRPLTAPRMPTAPPTPRPKSTTSTGSNDVTPAFGTSQPMPVPRGTGPIPTTSARTPNANPAVPPAAPAPKAAGATAPRSLPVIPLVAAAAVLIVLAGGAWWWRARQVAAPIESTPPVVDAAAAGQTPATEPPATPVGVPAPGAPPAGSTPSSTGASAGAPGSGAQTAGAARSTSAPPVPGTTTGARGGATTTTPPVGAGATVAGAAPAGATPAPPGPTVPAGRGPTDDPQQLFEKSRVLIVNGKQTNDQEVVLSFVNGQISLISGRGGTAIATVPYKAILHATYARARDPKWNAAYFSPPAGLDVGSVFRTAKNWLVLQMRDTFLILRLDDTNVTRVLQTVEARTGLTIERPRVDDK